MTDKEIVKALEICSTYKAKCTDCPAFVKVDRSNCKKVLLGALDIINRQKEEINRLSVLSELGNTRANDYRIMRDRALKAEQEIERLNKENGKLLNKVCEKMRKESKAVKKIIRAEAIKEFEERLIDEYDPRRLHTRFNQKSVKRNGW